MKFTAEAFGWMTVIEAPDAAEALDEAKDLASSASLLRSDITRVRPATQDDIDWYRGMTR